MEVIEISAKTIDDAILEAAIKLGTTRDKVVYEVVFAGSSGFLGIGSKNAVIKAHVRTEEEEKASQKAEKEVEKILKKVNEEKPVKKEKIEKVEKVEKAEKAEKPVKPVKPAKPVKEEKPVKNDKPVNPNASADVKVFLEKVFAAMEMSVDIKVTEGTEEHELNVELAGEDMGVLIGKRGQTLDSLQYLTSLVANKGSEGYIRVKVDTENYRERRKETLENLAKNISHKVRRTGKAVSLEPMNPYERRVIHSALQNDKFVCTHSEGEEPYRRVVVTLKEGVKPDGFERRGRRGYNRNYKKKER